MTLNSPLWIASVANLGKISLGIKKVPRSGNVGTGMGVLMPKARLHPPLLRTISLSFR